MAIDPPKAFRKVAKINCNFVDRTSEMKNCTPLWPEAHFQVKMYKTHQVRTTLGSWHVEKLHAVVARSTFPSQHVQSTQFWDHFWKWRCWKSARRCGVKHISKSKVWKTHGLGPFLEVDMLKKCTMLWREAQFEVKSVKTYGFGALLDVQMPFRVELARDYAPCQTWAKRQGFVAVSKTMAGVGHLKRIWKGSRRSTRDVSQSCSEVRALISWEGLHFGASDLQVCWDDFAWQVQHFVWPGITSYDLASLFRGMHSTSETWTGRIAKRIGTRPSALHSTFYVWRKSRRIASFSTLQIADRQIDR